ncbi:uncharacterized protein PHACADRAFT_212936 [Phanerochaete carnosa HHB-10118-sp]|uniref:Uncharacterized protein n=1 Tax=Phanerochaete carnosa (strain HHB-10118-sp) TaxID=650164 RepID=K5VW37_PHACS|nr:uncharacterized protein PHACADRAFT_212936 [Phanerochaete carnosa HHB-10118-sp]EKM51035.1 hypothetical protein PHACADRAFT_212936 [Phanerochaete carnosa HHB-10118-sp]
MAAHSSSSFASPDVPGDACVVLVLLESSPNMFGYWTELQGYYLPVILGALQNGTPDTPIHVYWQMTADPDNFQPTYSNSCTHIPDVPFDSALPLSLGALRRAVETVRAVELVGRATRHLLIIAANPPHNPAQFLPNGSHSPDAAGTREFVMTTLYQAQERIRLHMVLAANPRLQALRDFHTQLLRAQINAEVPAWFQVDSRQFTVHLSARPTAPESGASGSLPTHGASSILPRSGPVTPTSTSTVLPVASHSPPSMSAQGQPVTSSSPTRRTTRHKGKDAIVPTMDTQGPGLVNYLKQVHGLTKRKGVGGKAAKRAAAGEPSRSSRPILPRLELPVAGLSAPVGTDRSPTKPAQAAAAPAGPPPQQAGAAMQNQANTMGVPVGLNMTPPTDIRRLPGRSWPWIQPAIPMTSPSTVPSVSPTASAALRSLARIAPGVPSGAHGTRPSNQVSVHHTSTFGDTHVGDTPSPVASISQQQRQETYASYGLGSSPSPPQQLQGASSSPPYHPAVAASYHSTEGSSPTYQSSIAHEVSHASMYASGAYYGAYPYAISPPNSDHSNPSPPLPSPVVTTGGAHDPENQPFIVTPEYEALANARFADAVLSGAMHANMTPSALSPGATSPPVHGPGGYFASAPPPPPHAVMQGAPPPPAMPVGEYMYTQQGAGLDRDVHFSSRPGGGMSDPAHRTNYY